jgi:cysteinyl-tRNA synthetase
MQNATSDVTRLGTTAGLAYATLLDGIAHEEVFAPKADTSAEAELLAWKGMGLATKDGRPFWIAVEDYAGNCANASVAHAALAKSRARGFSPYVSDESGGQKVVCYWE